MGSRICAWFRVVSIPGCSRRHAEARSCAGTGARQGEPVALYVGRIAPEKNLKLVVDAFSGMRARVPQARLVMVGDGPERTALAADPGRAASLRVRARASAERIDWDNVFDDFEAVLRDVMLWQGASSV